MSITTRTLAMIVLFGLLAVMAPEVSAQQNAAVKRIDAQLRQMQWSLPTGVRVVLGTEPDTLVELVQAADMINNLDRPDVAHLLLQKVVAMKPTEEQLLEIGDQLGSGVLMRMANRDGLLPEAKLLSDSVIEAIGRRLKDVDRIGGFVDSLGDPDPNTRGQAIEQLRLAHRTSIAPLIVALSDPARMGEREQISSAFVAMGNDAVGPLLGLLERADPLLMAQAIKTLGTIGNRRAYYYLLGPYASDKSDPEIRRQAAAAIERFGGVPPTREQAIYLLKRRVLEFFEEEAAVAGLSDGQVEIWEWREGDQQCVPRKYSEADARRVIAARLARDAFALAPEDPEVRQLYLMTNLDAEIYEKGLDTAITEKTHPMAQKALAEGVELLEDVLARSVQADHLGAAIATARLLGESGATEILQVDGSGNTSPLIDACRHADRRLRMAAVESVLKLSESLTYESADGTTRATDFAGFGSTVDALKFFAASRGRPAAIVAAPTSLHGQRLAGNLTRLGYKTTAVTNGRDLITLAARSPDVELVLIDAATTAPLVERTIHALRVDSRTADLRVGVIARDGFFEQAEDAVDRDPLSMAFARPHDMEAATWQIDRLKELGTDRFVPRVHRDTQAEAALGHLAMLCREREHLVDTTEVFEVAVEALDFNPKLGPAALDVLACVEHPACQVTIVEAASRLSLPIESRQAAARAFAENVTLFGIQLTDEQVIRQYDRYNTSDMLDVKTQQVFGAILDAIEGKPQPKLTPDEDAGGDDPAAEPVEPMEMEPGGEDPDEPAAEPLDAAAGAEADQAETGLR